MNFIFCILIAFATVSFYSYETDAGFPGVNCKDLSVCFLYPFLPICLQTTLFPCNYDVQIFHGANSGTCDNSNYNCVCNYAGGTGTGANGGITGLLLNQCNAQNYTFCQCQANLTDVITQAYTDFCNFDCRCDHGAASGSCDFVNRKCICQYEGTWNQSVCPEYSPAGLNITGYTWTFANLLYSFCNYTLPLLNYQADYCYSTA